MHRSSRPRSLEQSAVARGPISPGRSADGPAGQRVVDFEDGEGVMRRPVPSGFGVLKMDGRGGMKWCRWRVTTGVIEALSDHAGSSRTTTRPQGAVPRSGGTTQMTG